MTARITYCVPSLSVVNRLGNQISHLSDIQVSQMLHMTFWENSDIFTLWSRLCQNWSLWNFDTKMASIFLPILKIWVKWVSKWANGGRFIICVFNGTPCTYAISGVLSAQPCLNIKITEMNIFINFHSRSEDSTCGTKTMGTGTKMDYCFRTRVQCLLHWTLAQLTMLACR